MAQNTSLTETLNKVNELGYLKGSARLIVVIHRVLVQEHGLLA